ncbi:MAG: hypothetical protein M1542_07505 [Thermotogae bacterium]|nr:hypothetical protein [Thermotogota bacterium]MCL5033070.1 hypothetical protein [Thermotogota bacterium]
MNWINFLEAVIIIIAVYLPLLLGKSKKNEENIFWASMASLTLAIVATFVTGNADIGSFNFSSALPIIVALIAGFISYGIHDLNFKLQSTKYSPITWLIFIPVTENLVFRHIGLFYTSEWVFKIQILAWYVTVNVLLFAIIAALIYFFIYLKNGLTDALVEAAMFFVIGLIAGYIYVNYGLLMAIVSELVFNLWRVIFGMLHAKIKESA